jgi:hypothetical protein
VSKPVAALHYASDGNFVNGQYAPGADGFNLADVDSASQLSELASGVEALVYLGMTGGVTAAFKAAVRSFIDSSTVYGFYLADDPSPSATTAANLKAESDWIHANDPGVKTFMVERNSSGMLTPRYYYTPANTGIDLFGLDAYPVQTYVPNHYDLNVIPLAIKEAEAIGIPQQDLVPVYQAFGGGGYPSYILPTAAEERQILSTWGSVLPNPAFDYAYSWGVQLGDTALSNDPALQKVFAAHNAVPAAEGSSAAQPASAPPIFAVRENSAVTSSGGDPTTEGNASEPFPFGPTIRPDAIGDFASEMGYSGADDFSAPNPEFAHLVALLGTGGYMGFDSSIASSDGYEHLASALNVAAGGHGPAL